MKKNSIKNLILIIFLICFNSCNKYNSQIILRYNDGTPKEEKIISNKKINFGNIVYYSNGKKKMRIINKGYQQTGNSKKQLHIEECWYNSGILAYQEIHENGIFEKGEYYDLQKKLVAKYRNGSGKRIFFYNNGNKMIVEKYSDYALLNGKYYAEDGKLISEIINGKGIQNLFYLTGEKRYIVEYDKGTAKMGEKAP